MKLLAHSAMGWFAVCALAQVASAQGRDAAELDALEPVVQAALQKASPFVVTIETFGGTRRKLAPSKNPQRDGQKPEPQSRPMPGTTPSPQRPPGVPEEDPDKPKPPPPNRGGKKPPGLVMEGFLQAQGATTGVVLSEDGWILVSRFSLNFDPTTILVTLADGKSYEASRAGEDKSRGIALLKVEAKGLPVAHFADPKDIKVGAWALALGRTFGKQEPSVHLGIVSAKDRQLGRAVQTDANTSPSNYGGPLVDVEGKVFGIVAPLSSSGEDAGAEMYDSGIGFAATIAGIEPLLERMKQGEILQRGWLGVMTKTEDLGPGSLLADISKNSPAESAGLKKGDRILEVDGVAVQNNFHLQMLIGSKMAGDPVHLKVERKSGEQPIGMTVFLGGPT